MVKKQKEKKKSDHNPMEQKMASSVKHQLENFFWALIPGLMLVWNTEVINTMDIVLGYLHHYLVLIIPYYICGFQLVPSSTGIILSHLHPIRHMRPDLYKILLIYSLSSVVADHQMFPSFPLSLVLHLYPIQSAVLLYTGSWAAFWVTFLLLIFVSLTIQTVFQINLNLDIVEVSLIHEFLYYFINGVPRHDDNANGLGDDEKMTKSEVQDRAGKWIPNDVGKAKVKDSPKAKKSENTSKGSQESSTQSNVDDYSSLCRSCSKTRTEVKLYKCAGCKKAKYCSRECIEHDWPDHQNWCIKQRKKRKIKKNF